jgi:hypothetical protein
MRVATVTLLALTVQMAYGAPTQAAAELSAIGCCAEHCDHPSADGRARCCHLSQPAASVGAVSRATGVSPSLVVAALPASPVPANGFADVRPIRPVGDSSPPAPIFLRTLSLRL